VTSTHEPAPDGGGFLRVRLLLSYDGKDFAGWARQPGLRTVHAELVAGLQRVLRVTDLNLVVAGRTDAGVHALGQVCHVDLPADAWPGDEAAVRRLNAVLAPDVRVIEAGPAAPGFHARFSARWRRYEYLISDSGRLDPRARGSVLLHRTPLNCGVMHDAGQHLVGEHDFSAFCRRRPGASSVRTVLGLQVSRRVDPRDGALMVVDISADAFCHSMVRSVVGALIAVGAGRLSDQQIATMVSSGQRLPGFSTAPAHALALMEVQYPPDDELAQQAVRARRFRSVTAR
jgi:tRNA pseudouridine38-40 synthase